MGEKKVARMVLKVNLQCSTCYLKVKKVLCKFSQIQDQVYDEKQNKVTIKVVCCSPEKIRDKIRCEGGCSVKNIEILPEEQDQHESDYSKEVTVDGPPDAGNDTQRPPDLSQRDQNRVGMCCRECNEGRGGGPCYQRGRGQVRCEDGYGPEKPNPVGVCCRDCYEGRGGGPCYQLGRGQVRCDDGHYGPGPVPMPCNPPVPNPVGVCCGERYEVRGGGPCHQLGYRQVRYEVGYCGRPVYDSWGSGSGCDRVYYRNRCTDYISEENPTACRIM